MDGVIAYIMINVRVGAIRNVVNGLRKIEKVRNISVVAGEYDIIVRVEVADLEELFEITERIHGIDGIERTTTQIVEKEYYSKE